MLFGHMPWPAKSSSELLENIQKNKLDLAGRKLSSETIDALEKMLQIDEKDRINWSSLFVHPAFKKRTYH